MFLFISSALNNLKKGDFGGSSRLVDVLFGETDLSSPYNLKGWHHRLVLFSFYCKEGCYIPVFLILLCMYNVVNTTRKVDQ